MYSAVLFCRVFIGYTHAIAGGRDRRFLSYPLLLPYPFFSPSRRLLFQSTRPLPSLCPRMCQLFFSPSFTHVCLLSVGIHPSVRIIITEEFYRGRCSLLIKAFSVCVPRDSPAVFILSTSIFFFFVLRFHAWNLTYRFFDQIVWK